MEITVKNKLGVITISALRRFTLIVLLLIIGLIVFTAALPGTYNPVLVWLGILSIPGLYIAFVVLNTWVFCKKTRLELQDNSLELESGDLINSNNHTFTLHQIESIGLAQSFLLKLIGACQVNIFHGETVTSYWGFDYDEAKQLVEAFGKKTHLKTK
jgi:uncharacterized membrane protein YdbT with pleckstrin-like domain